MHPRHEDGRVAAAGLGFGSLVALAGTTLAAIVMHGGMPTEVGIRGRIRHNFGVTATTFGGWTSRV